MGKIDAHDRLLEAVEYLKNNGKARRQEDVAIAMGVPRPHVSTAMKGDTRRLTDSFLRRFAKAYSDYINENWLLTGDGEMAKVDKKATRPHIPADRAVVSAGFEGKAIGSVAEGECEVRPVMAPFPWYDFTIQVEGDSMEPELRNGDTIACQWLNNSDELRTDKIYVVDSAEGAVVKQLSNDGKELLCHSINPLYDDFKIHKSNVLRIARVIGLIREL